MVAEFKEAIMKEYEMTDLGPMKYFLGIQVRQYKGEIFISQENYFEDCESAFFSGYSGPRIPGLNEKKGREDLVDRALAHRS